MFKTPVSKLDKNCYLGKRVIIAEVILRTGLQEIIYLTFGIPMQWREPRNQTNLTKSFPFLSDLEDSRKYQVGPQIKKNLNQIVNDPWFCFKADVKKMLGNYKAENYKEIVSNVFQNYNITTK